MVIGVAVHFTRILRLGRLLEAAGPEFVGTMGFHAGVVCTCIGLHTGT